jgi:hypothetical protein
MLINRIISQDEDYESGGPMEPATLSEVKSYLRLQGFTADDDSGESEFDYDDNLLTDMITEARMWVEKFTGIHVVPKTLTVVLLNQAGGCSLPGPVAGDITITDCRGDAVTDFSTVGTGFKSLVTCFHDRITVEYDAGYESAPSWVKRAILAYIAWHYENRGDEQTGSPVTAAAICRPHRRVNVWA